MIVLWNSCLLENLNSKTKMIKNYLNINGYCNYNLINPKNRNLITLRELSEILPSSIAQLELSKDKEIEIPKEVLNIYSKFRPTPLFRARNFEKAIGTSCEIYIKDEGLTLTGNHKANSAYLIAYLCKKDKVKIITTETTGNWGIALAKACKKFGLEAICFIDYDSHRKRPDRKSAMEKEGSKVIVVEQDSKHSDLLTLSADAAIKYTKNLENATYIFGSVYNYFIIPQSIIGLEAKEQLGKYPDIVVGSCGGGANLLGTSAAFIADKLDNKSDVDILSAESEKCPILTRGKKGLYSIDNLNYFPLIETYGLDGLVNGEYIGGLGSTIVASPVAEFHSRGIIKARTYNSEEARKAAKLFYESERKWVALESSYQLASVIDKARENKKVILVNISSGNSDTQFYGGNNEW